MSKMNEYQATELRYPSRDGKTKIFALLWGAEQSQARAVIQITHGMEEHIGRYQQFASYLTKQGFIVCGQDMLGHGRSVTSSKALSSIPAHEGKNILLEDAHSLRKIISTRYPDLPYIMFGHSMGSFLMRCYAARYGAGLAALILCGTGYVSPLLSVSGMVLARILARIKGENYRSKILIRLGTGAYSKEIKDPHTSYDWLAFNRNTVDAFIADQLCGVPFSASSYAVLTSLTYEASKLSLAKHIPSYIPVYLIAGTCDPVGDDGKGVMACARLLERAGVEKVDVKLYQNMRHEILNECDSAVVYSDVVKWTQDVMRKREAL